MNMKLKSQHRVGPLLTFVASAAVGCVVIAFAGAAAVSHDVPAASSTPAATEIVRLEPVVVTISRAAFDQARRDAAAADGALARGNDAKKVTRG